MAEYFEIIPNIERNCIKKNLHGCCEHRATDSLRATWKKMSTFLSRDVEGLTVWWFQEYTRRSSVKIYVAQREISILKVVSQRKCSFFEVITCQAVREISYIVLYKNNMYNRNSCFSLNFYFVTFQVLLTQFTPRLLFIYHALDMFPLQPMINITTSRAFIGIYMRGRAAYIPGNLISVYHSKLPH